MNFKALSAVFVTISLIGCKPDPNEAANAIFVNAQSQMNDYLIVSNEKPDELDQRITLLTAINAGVNQIVQDYPGSDLAVKLAIGPVGDISTQRVREDLLDLQEEQTCLADLRACILSEAVDEFSTLPSLSAAFDGLINSVDLYYELEDLDAARGAMAIAEARLRDSQGDGYFDTASGRLARIQAMLGHLETALGTIASISKPHKRAEELTDLAVFLVENNPNDPRKARDLMYEAREIVEQSGKPAKRCWLRKAEATFETRLGNFLEAGRIGNAMELDECANNSLYYSALAANRAEQIDASEELLTLAVTRVLNAADLDKPFWALSRIAKLRMENGTPSWRNTFDQAHETARKTRDNQRLGRFSELFEIARGAGNLELAREMLDEMLYLVPTLASDTFSRISNITKVAKAHIALDETSNGLAIIDANLEGAEQASAKIYLLEELTLPEYTTLKAELLSQAERAASLEPDRQHRAHALALLSEAHMYTGDHTKALPLAREAFKTLGATTRFGSPEAEIAGALLGVGEIDEAVAVLRPVENSSSYFRASNSAIRNAGSDAELDRSLKAIFNMCAEVTEPEFQASLLEGMISGWLVRNWKMAREPIN